MEGEVVAVGPGARGEKGKLDPLDVKAGDRILFGKWSGTEVKLDGEELLIMKESDIMGIIEGTPPRAPRRPPEPCPIQFRREEKTWLPKKSVSWRCARAHAARRRHPRQRGQGDAGPEGPQRRPRQVLRRAAHHQGRRHRRQGDRARRQVREHGRADGARSRPEDQRHRRRRHHHGDRARPGDRARGRARRWPPA